MEAKSERAVTVAEFLAMRGLPIDWRYASVYGRVVAQIYRAIFRREPARTQILLNGKFRPVMAYAPDEAFVLEAAWAACEHTQAVTGPALDEAVQLLERTGLVMPGAVVDYHGSMTAHRGIYVAQPCACRYCQAGDVQGLDECRYHLTCIGRPGRNLQHARRESITVRLGVLPV